MNPDRADGMPRPEPPATIYVVDDDAAIRTAIDSLLRSLGMQVRTFGSVAEFLERDEAPPGASCLVLDVRLPGINGLDLLHAASRTAQRTLPPTIVVTGHGDIPMSVRAMKDGAQEFLCKPFREADLLRAVRQALAVDRAGIASHRHMATLQARYSRLTRREHEVLHAAVSGLLNKQIASQLGMSEATVKQHRAQIMRKMEVQTFAELVRATEQLRTNP